jgi:hypothetical protein
MMNILSAKDGRPPSVGSVQTGIYLHCLVIPDMVYQDFIWLVILDVCYRESILPFFRWIPATYLRG